MDRVVGAEPPDRQSLPACQRPPKGPEVFQELPLVGDAAARRLLCMMVHCQWQMIVWAFILCLYSWVPEGNLLVWEHHLGVVNLPAWLTDQAVFRWVSWRI